MYMTGKVNKNGRSVRITSRKRCVDVEMKGITLKNGTLDVDNVCTS